MDPDRQIFTIPYPPCYQSIAPTGPPPGATLAELSPTSQLAVLCTQKKRVSATEGVGQHLLTHAKIQPQEVMHLGRKDQHLFVKEMAAVREEEQRSQEMMCQLYIHLSTLRDVALALMRLKEACVVS